MVANSWQQRHSLPDAVEVTDDLVRQARSIIESLLPGQAGNMDAVLLAGVAHALALKEQQRRPLRH